jgi:ligand-binding sensor domain-containing protein
VKISRSTFFLAGVVPILKQMKIFFTSICFFLISNYCQAQFNYATDYTVTHITDENGLPQNSIRSIAQDQMGFVWLATEGGLVRYDGLNFKVFTKKSLGIPSDRFYRFRNSPNQTDFFAFSEYNGAVHILNGVASIDSSRPHSRDVDKPLLEALVKNRLASPTITRTPLSANFRQLFHAVPGNGNRFYAYHDNRVVFFEAGKIIGHVPFAGPMTNTLKDYTIELKKYSESDLEVLSLDNFIPVDHGLFYHTRGVGNKFLYISVDRQHKVELSGDILKQPEYSTLKEQVVTYYNPVNKQAFAYLRKKLYRLHNQPGNSNLVTQLVLENYDLRQNHIASVLADVTDGTLYLGSLTKGLVIIRPKHFQARVLQDEGFGNIFYAQVPFNSSSVITPEGITVSAETLRSGTFSTAVKMNEVIKYTMMKDFTGAFWIKTSNGIKKIDKRLNTKTFQSSKEISRIYQGLDSTIWIGYRDGDLAVLSEQNKQGGQFLHKKSLGADITFLFQYQKQDLWIGTANGIYNIDLVSNKLDSIPELKGKNIRSITSTSTGHICITTYGNGIYIYKNRRIVAIPPDQRGYLNYAHCMVEDERGYFWITTNKGLFEIPKRDLINYAEARTRNLFFRYYDKSDGFLTNEFNGGCQPCGVRLEKGYISLPSMNGLIWFKPEQSSKNSLANSFIFENAEIDGDSISLTDTLYLSYNYSALNIELAAPFFITRNNLNVSYSLRKNDDTSAPNWIAVGENLKLSIYNLSHGEYNLVIRKTTGFNDQYIEKKLILMVETPWYLQFWFIGLSAAFVVGVLWAYSKWRTRSLIQSNQLLSARVEERTMELSEALQNLQDSEHSLSRQLQLQIRILAVVGHDLQSPLRYLDRHSLKLYQALNFENINPQLLELSQSISESTSRVSELANNLLNFMKSTLAKNGTIDTTLINLEEILSSKAIMFVKLAKENETQIVVDVEGVISIRSNVTMLSIIIHNLVDNAVKSAWQDTITLSAKKIGSNTRVTVADSVGGLSEEIVGWLNSVEGSDSDQLNSYPSSLGLGLIMVREISHLLSISISVDANDEATAFHLDFV